MSCSLIDACLLEGIQAATESLMVDTFKIQSYSGSSNNAGGQDDTWADEATGVPGYMEGSKEWSRELMTGEHEQEVRRWTITLKKGTTVDASRRIIQTHQNGTAITPRYFKVISAIFGQTVDFGVICECSELPNLS
jgi:hypothetical protein